jgi:nitrate reductase beta subunit
MKVMAQLAMVMNLDKCIGCHTCSVTCKQAWTNRTGTEYVWFNNVETRPGVGYPRTYEDQDRWRGGWVRDKEGQLRLRDGGRILLPIGCDVQAQRGRHRAGRPGPLPWLADVRLGMPLQEGVFQPQDRQSREVHVVLPAHGSRPADHLLGNLRGTVALPRAGALRRRQGAGASVEQDTDLYHAQCQVFLDPHDPKVIAGAKAEGIFDEWIGAAQRSPVYALINKYKVALPLHPEYRTMPMVWYIPPLSPVVDAVSRGGHDGEDLGNLFGAMEALRIPMQYLAELFTAGDTSIVEHVLRRLAAMRSYMRDINLGRETQPHIPHSVGMTEEETYEMYRLLAIAKYEERYVIPTAYTAQARDLEQLAGCSLDGDGGPGMYQGGPFGGSDRGPVPVSVETFHTLNQPAGKADGAIQGNGSSRVNLLNWDGREVRAGIFPEKHQQPEEEHK